MIQNQSDLTITTNKIAKPQGSMVKDICKELNLQKSDYQGYRVSSNFIIINFFKI